MLRSSIRLALLAATLAYPLPGANHDGVYALVSVDGQSLPYNLIFVNAKNRLVLTKGAWTLSGNQLTIAMYKTSVVKGTSTSEARFNPERHAGRLTISGSAATGTLDSGSPVSATFEAGTMLATYDGHRMKFEKK